jgi:hypothetical protein
MSPPIIGAMASSSQSNATGLAFVYLHDVHLNNHIINKALMISYDVWCVTFPIMVLVPATVPA